jgi:hypothetical protein
VQEYPDCIIFNLYVLNNILIVCTNVLCRSDLTRSDQMEDIPDHQSDDVVSDSESETKDIADSQPQHMNSNTLQQQDQQQDDHNDQQQDQHNDTTANDTTNKSMEQKRKRHITFSENLESTFEESRMTNQQELFEKITWIVHKTAKLPNDEVKRLYTRVINFTLCGYEKKDDTIPVECVNIDRWAPDEEDDTCFTISCNSNLPTPNTSTSSNESSNNKTATSLEITLQCNSRQKRDEWISEIRDSGTNNESSETSTIPNLFELTASPRQYPPNYQPDQKFRILVPNSK